MLRALLALVLVVPGAAAWSIELHAPAAAGAGLPYLVEACIDVAGELHLGREPYAPAAAGCHDLVAREANLTVRLRPPGGSAKATAVARVALTDAPLAAVASQGAATLVDGEGRALLRVPASAGTAFLPLLDGAVSWRDDAGEHALPTADRPRLVAIRGPPFSGALVANDGAAPLRLAGRTLGAPLPDTTLAPGARVFLGAKAPPDAPFVPWAMAKSGPWVLRAGEREEGRIAAPETGMGRTALSPETFHAHVRLLATPDAGAAPVVALLEGAQREVLVEGYTITSVDIAAALARALDRGAAVRVLLEGAPVGGRPADEGAIVSALVARGAHVGFLGGEGAFAARYATLHAKTMVVDRQRVLVSTDNFHDSSFPPAGEGTTRGFALIAEDAALASRFAEVFEADDAPWPDVHPADDAAVPATLVARAGAEARAALDVGDVQVMPVFSPDDATSDGTLLGILANATARIDVEMLFADAKFADAPDPFLDALVAAARRHVTVRVLLDGKDDGARNRETAARLDALAAREGLDLDVQVAGPARLLHAKMVVADDALYVGSMNWGFASATRNREAGLILLHAPEAAAWARHIAEQDWQGWPVQAAKKVPLSWETGVALLTTAAASRARRSWRSRRAPRAGASRATGRGRSRRLP